MPLASEILKLLIKLKVSCKYLEVELVGMQLGSSGRFLDSFWIVWTVDSLESFDQLKSFETVRQV